MRSASPDLIHHNGSGLGVRQQGHYYWTIIECLIASHFKCRTSIVIHGRNYVDKVAYDCHDPYNHLYLIMILLCDQHKDEFILHMRIMSYY